MNLTAEAIGIAGMVIMLLATAVAMYIDYKIHRGNPAPPDTTKIYRPNLRIWGGGFFVGAGIFSGSLFGYALQRIILKPPPVADLWPMLSPLFFLTAVIGLLAWAIVILCQYE